jgi:hypothetical protein
MQYQVPQFIEFEDKIFGPLTLKQFVYLAGGGALGFLVYKTLPFILAVLIGVPIISFSAALAFYKPDGHRPFIFMVEQALKFYSGSKLYLWKHREKKIDPNKAEAAKESSVYIPKLSDSKLKEISWSLDIHDNIEAKKSNSKFKF